MNSHTAAVVRLLEEKPPANGPSSGLHWLGRCLDLLTADPRPAEEGLAAFLLALRQQPPLLTRLREVIWQEIDRRNHLSFLVEAGLPQETSFLDELLRRVGNALLPPVPDDFELSDLAQELFSTRERIAWVQKVPPDQWAALFALLAGDAPHDGALLELFSTSIPSAILIVAQRIAALGVEPEITRRLPALEHYHSPFIRLGVDVGHYLDDWSGKEATQEELEEAFHALRILQAYCLRSVETVHRSHDETGISLRVVALLERLRKCLERLQALLGFLEPLEKRDLATQAARLFLKNTLALSRRNSVRDHWSVHTELLALKIIEHNSHSGEHYISRNRREFFGLLGSALGGGAVTAFTSLLKILIGKMTLAPLVTASAQAINYSASFVLIQLCHFSLATKQPAMTASVLAAALTPKAREGLDLRQAAGLVTQICRSQIISVVGNLSAVIPVSLALHFLWLGLTGHSVCDPAKAHHVLEANHPWHSPSLWYAAITGGCLFFSGMVSGYFDNVANCFALHERVRRHVFLRRWLGGRLVDTVANHLYRGFGGVAGNVALGVVLGFMPFLSAITGLPLDVRHVTLATGNLVLALVGLGSGISVSMILSALGSVALIGTINLLVSFGLSLALAARSRGTHHRLLRRLLAEVWRNLWRTPVQFIYPKAEQPLALPAKPEST